MSRTGWLSVKELKTGPWSIGSRLFFSHESPFELYNPPNPKNDVIWSYDKNEIEHVPVEKYSPKVMVWGAMSFTGLTELHIVPQKQFVD